MQVQKQKPTHLRYLYSQKAEHTIKICQVAKYFYILQINSIIQTP